MSNPPNLNQYALYLGDAGIVLSYDNNTQKMIINPTCQFTINAIPSIGSDCVNKAYVDAGDAFLSGVNTSTTESLKSLINYGQSQDALSITSLSSKIISLSTSTSTIGSSLSSSIKSLSTSTSIGVISLSTGLSNEVSTRTSQGTTLSSSITSLSTSTSSDVVSLSTSLSTTSITLSNTITSLSTSSSTQNSSLNSQITLLSTSTSSGIVSLSTGLSNEVSTRTSQGTSLSSSITSLSTSTSSDVVSLSTSLSTTSSTLSSTITSLSTSSSTQNSSLNSQITSLSTSSSSGIVSLSTGISNEVSTRISQGTSLSSSITALSTSTSSEVVSLSTGISNEVSTRISQGTSLSSSITALSTSTSSEVVSLSTGLSNEVSTRISQGTSLSSSITALSTSTSSDVVSLSTSTSSDVVSLSTSLSTTSSTLSSTITSLSTSSSTQNSSLNSQITSLSTSTSSEILIISTSLSTTFSRLIFTESIAKSNTELNIISLSISISSLSTSSSSEIISLSSSIVSLSTSTSSTTISLSSSITSLSIKTTDNLTKTNNSNYVNTVVPLNSKTINGGANPIPTSRYPSQETAIDGGGWYFLTTYKGGTRWTVYPTGTNGTSSYKYSSLGNIYYTVTFNKLTPRLLIPKLYLYFNASIYLVFSAPTSGVTYPLYPGTYTFAIRFDNTIMGNTNNMVNTDYNNLVGTVINLSLDAENSSTSTPNTIVSSMTLNCAQIITPAAYSSCNYIVTGDSAGVGKYSTDGITYNNTINGTNLTSIRGGNGFILSYSNVLWILYGDFTSTTSGIAYCPSISGSFSNVSSSIFSGINVSGSINSINYNNEYSNNTSFIMFLAGGQISSGGTIDGLPLAYSTNGLTWTQLTTKTYPTLSSKLSSTDVINVIYYVSSSNKWLIGLNGRPNYSSLITVTNSETDFSFEDAGLNNMLDDYIIDIDGNYNGTLFLAVGKGSLNNNNIIVSPNGNPGSWTPVTTNLFSDTMCVKTNNKMWLIGGSGTNNSLAYSFTGFSNWIGLSKNTATNPFETVSKIVWTGLTWVACGTMSYSNADITLAYSYSGTVWIKVTTETNITALCNLYPNLYQFSLNNLYIENSKDTNLAAGTIQYCFNSDTVDNNYQYNTMNKLLDNFYKLDQYAYSDPLCITTF